MGRVGMTREWREKAGRGSNEIFGLTVQGNRLQEFEGHLKALIREAETGQHAAYKVPGKSIGKLWNLFYGMRGRAGLILTLDETEDFDSIEDYEGWSSKR